MKIFKRIEEGESLTAAIIGYKVAELGEMLPSLLDNKYFVTQKGLMGNLWYCSMVKTLDDESEHSVESKNEADARAKMLIYLLENDLIK